MEKELFTEADRLYTEYLKRPIKANITTQTKRRKITLDKFIDLLPESFWYGRTVESEDLWWYRFRYYEIDPDSHLRPTIGQKLPLLQQSIDFLRRISQQLEKHSTLRARHIRMVAHLMECGCPADSIERANFTKPHLDATIRRIKGGIEETKSLIESLKSSELLAGVEHLETTVTLLNKRREWVKA